MRTLFFVIVLALLTLSAHAQSLSLVGDTNLGSVFTHAALGPTVASKNIVLKNTGGTPVTISGIRVTGDFTVTAINGQNPSATTVNPGESVNLTVSFASLHRGAQVAQLFVATLNGRTLWFNVVAEAKAPATSVTWGMPVAILP